MKKNLNNCLSYNYLNLKNGRLIFDSQTIDKSNLFFFSDHFTLYGKTFPYQGMAIKRK